MLRRQRPGSIRTWCIPHSTDTQPLMDGKPLRPITELRGEKKPRSVAYRSAIQAFPEKARLWTSFGSTALDLGRTDLALKAYQEGNRLEPHPETYYNIGLTCEVLGKKEEAMAAYASAVKMNPRLPRALNNLGSLLLERGAFEKAAACFRTALSADNSLARVHNNLGLTYFGLNDLAKAEQCYLQAIRQNPSTPQPYGNLAEVYEHIGLHDRARPLLAQALRLAPHR